MLSGQLRYGVCGGDIDPNWEKSLRSDKKSYNSRFSHRNRYSSFGLKGVSSFSLMVSTANPSSSVILYSPMPFAMTLGLGFFFLGRGMGTHYIDGITARDWVVVLTAEPPLKSHTALNV